MSASTTTSWSSRAMIRVGAISAALAVAATIAVASGSDPVGPATPAAATTAASPTATPTAATTDHDRSNRRPRSPSRRRRRRRSSARPPSTSSAPTTPPPAATARAGTPASCGSSASCRSSRENAVDVVGFQEFQPPQAVRFQELTGTSWQTYPGANNPAGPSVNSIGWRTDVWQLLEARTLPIPYFDGVPSRMPAVLLQNIETGRRVWFFNTHNPADVRGPAQQWRDAGFAMEAALANELRTNYPDAPFISFGDKNDRDRYYCSVAPVADMWSASGGYVDGATCSPPGGGAIDWIMGTKDVFFNGYTRYWNDFVAQTSDHPLYYANAVVPASRPAGVDHVVVVAVPGLTSTVVRKMGSSCSRARPDGAGRRLDEERPDRHRVHRRPTPTWSRSSPAAGSSPRPAGTASARSPRCRRPSTSPPGSTSPASSTSRTTSRGARASSPAGRRASSCARAGTSARAARTPTASTTAPPSSTRSRPLRDDAAVVSWWRSKMATQPRVAQRGRAVGRRCSAGTADGYTSDAYQKAVQEGLAPRGRDPARHRPASRR